jgi:hypothetical protein
MTDLKKLRELAEKSIESKPTGTGCEWRIHYDYEKATNPETVIALLDTIKKLKDERTRLRRSVRKVIRLSEEIEKYDAGKVDMAIARMARVFRGEP